MAKFWGKEPSGWTPRTLGLLAEASSPAQPCPPQPAATRTRPPPGGRSCRPLILKSPLNSATTCNSFLPVSFPAASPKVLHALPGRRRGPWRRPHMGLHSGPLRLTSGIPTSLPLLPPAHVPKAATTHQLSPSRAPHRRSLSKACVSSVPQGASHGWHRRLSSGLCSGPFGSCCAQRSSQLGGNQQALCAKAGFEGHCVSHPVHSSLSRGHGPAWSRMGPREALHRSVLLCVSQGPICSRTLVSRSCCLSCGGGGGSSVLGSVGHRASRAVITPGSYAR